MTREEELRAWRVALVRRLVGHSKTFGYSGVFLAVEEVDAVLYYAPEDVDEKSEAAKRAEGSGSGA